MGIVGPLDQPYSLKTRKKLGIAYTYGQRIYGKLRYGIEEPILGEAQYGIRIYSDTKYGNAKGFFGIYRVLSVLGKQVVQKREFYIPSNPQSGPQQSNRQKITDGVAAWQALTDEQKDVYNERAKYKKLSGYNLFLREYLLSH